MTLNLLILFTIERNYIIISYPVFTYGTHDELLILLNSLEKTIPAK